MATIRQEDGPLTLDEAIEWTTEQLSQFPNHASDPEKAEAVLKQVNELVRTHFEQMGTLHKRWKAAIRMMAGNTLERSSRYDIHVPEVYKVVESLVPRLEEAIFDVDPFFKVKGKNGMDEDTENTLAAFYEWQLTQSKAKDNIQAELRDLIQCSAQARKIVWKRETQKRRVRTVTQKPSDGGKPAYEFEWKDSEEVVFDGAVPVPVDPFCFMIDTRATDANDAAYVGDLSRQSYSALKQMERLGFLQNVDRLRDGGGQTKTGADARNKRPASIYDIPENKQNDAFRNPAHAWGDQFLSDIEGHDPKFWIAELYCKYDLHGDGHPVECVFTVGDGRQVLQIRENYYDRQIRPYSTSRCAKTGHHFYSVGPLDNAIRVNIDLDRIRKHASRASELTVNPLVFVENGSSLPSNLYEVRPGEVFQGVGNVTITRMPNTLESWLSTEANYKQDIEEIVGNPRVFMGGDVSGTATEMERRVKEANRRSKALIRSYVSSWVDTLGKMHILNQNFSVAKTRFRVLGKKAKKLGNFLEVGPDTLMADVDFEFVGVTSLHTYDMRATALQNIVQTALPVMVEMPDRFDLPSAIERLITLTVSPEDAEVIVRQRDDIEDMMPQMEENFMLRSGQRVDVNQNDNDKEHLQDMLRDGLIRMTEEGKIELADGKLDVRAKHASYEHAMQHVLQAMRKKDREAAKARSQQSQDAMRPPEAGGQRAAQSPRSGGMSVAAQGQPLPGQTPNQTPGPQRPGAMSRMGRDQSAIAQGQDGFQ